MDSFVLVLPFLGEVLVDLRLKVWQCCAIDLPIEAVSSSTPPREQKRRRPAMSIATII
jgi:hypothetical protein